MTTATRNEQYTAMYATEPVLFLAFALSAKTWKLGFTTGHGQQLRERSITARHQARLLHMAHVTLFLRFTEKANRVGGSSRVKTYGSVEHAIFQLLADRCFYQ